MYLARRVDAAEGVVGVCERMIDDEYNNSRGLSRISCNSLYEARKRRIKTSILRRLLRTCSYPALT